MARIDYTRESGKEMWSKASLMGAGAMLVAMPLTIGAAIAFGWPAWVPIVSASTMGGGGFLATSIAQLRAQHILEHAIYAREVKDNTDYNGDNIIGDPEEPRIVYVHKAIGANTGKQDFRFFVEGVWGTTGSAWREWDKREMPSGQPMERKVWETYTEQLIKSGVARRADPRANAPLIRTATLEQAIAKFEDAGLV